MKNFKLLLAGTAILSMGASLVNADVTHPTTSIKAYVDLANPVTVTYEPIVFGVLDISAGGYVAMGNAPSEPNSDSTARMINENVSRGKLIFQGGAIAELLNIGAGVLFDLPAGGISVPLKDGNTECGTLNIESIEHDDSEGTDTDVYIPHSKFTIKPNLTSTTYLKCSGTATITYFLDYNVNTGD